MSISSLLVHAPYPPQFLHVSADPHVVGILLYLSLFLPLFSALRAAMEGMEEQESCSEATPQSEQVL